MANSTLKVQPIMGVITPYALAKFAHHMFCMARGYPVEGDAFLSRQYLYCVAVELGLKGAILGNDCTNDKKKSLQNMGHDLVKLDKHFEKIFGESLFDQEDKDAITMINPYFKGKGIEYFTPDVLESTLGGRSGMPSLANMERVAAKVEDYLAARNYIIDGRSSETPQGGIIDFI